VETKPLLFAVIGFLLGGLVVSFDATQLDEQTGSGDEMTMTQMTEDLADRSGDDYDAAFIAAMVEHHQSAVDMAKLSASRAEHEEIKQLSQEIIEAQEREIAQMRQWQQDWGYGEEH
jgi:uncharacterized protein (DUF305 family)